MTRGLLRLAPPALATGLLFLMASLSCGPSVPPGSGDAVQVARPPHLDPDYAGIVVPPNIAPLNFTIDEPGERYFGRFVPELGDPIELASDSPGIRLAPGAWRAMLAANRGRRIAVEISTRDAAGGGSRFEPVTIEVAPDDIDGYMVYRRFRPLYSKYVSMGIYQRDLSSFDESIILHNRSAGGACLNCHSFAAKRPDPMVLHTRGDHGLTMLLAAGGTVSSIDTRTEFNRSPAAYTAWHPSGRFMAFSVNKVSLFYHTIGETRDVFDAASDLALYFVDEAMLTTCEEISHPDSLETWPDWSADGRYLYFSRAPALSAERFREVRYDLMRIAYDAERRTWGKLETVLAAAETGLSITQPKASPDGRFVVFCMSEYGNFPVYLRSSDLYLLDLRRGEYRRLELNSEESDSWHSWSSNGRWLAFSSKRRDGLFARPHLAHVDADGHASKAFVLPQEDPAYYRSCIHTFNVPELVSGPVSVGAGELGGALRDPSRFVQAVLDPALRAGSALTDTVPADPYSRGGVQ